MAVGAVMPKEFATTEEGVLLAGNDIVAAALLCLRTPALAIFSEEVIVLAVVTPSSRWELFR